MQDPGRDLQAARHWPWRAIGGCDRLMARRADLRGVFSSRRAMVAADKLPAGQVVIRPRSP
jgi:hypothetical protein